MGVTITGGELFVNAAWTTAKKVPAKSPFGVELVYGENAFATLDEAIAYAAGGENMQFIVGDKVVAVSDADGEVTFISSKEIKGTMKESISRTGVTYTAQSKQSVANKITLDDSQAASATVAGFKEVVLNGGSAEFNVLGGANTVTHVYAVNATAKSSTIKDSGTVSGKADGTLTVNGATVLTAAGAWAEVESENGAEITPGAAAFKFAYPDDPESIGWIDSDVSILDYLPGYATVTLADGASAEMLMGGTFDFTHATDAVYTVDGKSAYLSSLNKTLTYTRKNSGKLTVTDSVFDDAVGYAAVAVTGAGADFDILNNEVITENYTTTFKETRSAKNTTVKATQKNTVSVTADGTLTVEDIGVGGETERDVYSFSKVTVKDARLGMVTATGEKAAWTSSAETVTTPTAGGSSVKVTTSETGSENDTAGGTIVTARDAAFKDIMGYSKVDLVNATVEQDIRIAGGGRVVSYSRTYTATTVDEVLMQSKTVRKEDYAVAGTVTMNGGSVGRIEGAATVTLTDVTVGSIDDGGALKENFSEELSVNSKTGALTRSYSSSSAGQLKGTVTMTGGAVTGSAGILGYQTVTLDGAAVAGDINDYDAYKTTFSGYKNEFSDSGVTLTKQTYSSGFSYAPAAALTLKNGATVAGNAYGVKTLTLSSGAEISGFVEMRDGGMQESSTVTSKGGLYTENYQYSSGNAAPGTVTLNGATVGNLRAAGKVTATDATIGYINGYSESSLEKITRVGSNLFSGYDGRFFVNPASGLVSINSSYTYSETAAGNATLTRTSAADLYAVATVKMTGGGIMNASAGNSRSINSAVSSAAGYNAVYSNTWGTVGNFTATSGGVMGSIAGYSTVTLDHTTVSGGVVGSQYDGYRFGSMNVSSSLKQTFTKDGATLLTQNFASARSYAPTATLTLKNGAVVSGSAAGIKTLTLNAGTVVSGAVYMANYGMKDTGSITSNRKTGLYEQKKQYTSSQGAAGAATITGTAGDTNQVCGNISGAAKVTATDAVIGSLMNYATVQSDNWTRRGAELTSYYQSRYINEPTEYTSTCGFSQKASGIATLTRTNGGRIVDFATVNMTGGGITGASAGTSGSSFVTALKGGVYTFSQVSSCGVDGTFTATGAEITGDNQGLTRFAKVTLTDCKLTGADAMLLGGNSTETMSGTGASVVEAVTNAQANATYAYAAAGTLTATRTVMEDCVVSNYATVTLTDCALKAVIVDDEYTAKTALTFAGTANLIDDGDGADAFLIARYASVTVKSGRTLVGGGFRGTDGNDSITVNAKSELDIEGAAEFGKGTDALTVNGTARIAGVFDAGSLEKLSGSGMLALSDAGAAALRASIDARTTKLSGKIEIIAAGGETGDVLAVRTKKEELADNTAAKARKFTGDEMIGWLSGVEDADAYKFADTEDWISFTASDGLDYGVELSDAARNTDLSAELYRDGTKISDLVWNDMADRFEIESALAAGAEYQLHLTVDKEKSALSYIFSGELPA